MKVGDHVKVNRATWDPQAAKAFIDPLKDFGIGLIVDTAAETPGVFAVRYGPPGVEQVRWIIRDYLIPATFWITEMP